MKTFFRNIILNNWQRKIISILLAVIIWFVVNHSLTISKTLTNIPVRVINLPTGKTVQGLQQDHLLEERLTLVLVGNETVLEEITSNDLEVVVDAANKQDEWTMLISKKNLVSLNPEIDLLKGISRVVHQTLTLKMTKLLTETIPVIITQPVGEAPRGYQYLEVWPYSLGVNVSGPEDVIKRLKTKKLKLTFNLHNIGKSQLDAMQADSKKGDVVSFFVPDSWKQVSIPAISNTPIDINDPHAKALRIDFVHYDLLPLDSAIPISLFFPAENSNTVNPQNYTIASNDFVKKVNGLAMLANPLYVKGVSQSFLQIVKNRFQIVILAAPQKENDSMQWSIQFINPSELEDKYVALLMSDLAEDELSEFQPKFREEYLRNRFRNYMSHFCLFRSEKNKLNLDIHLEDHTVVICEPDEKNPPT